MSLSSGQVAEVTQMHRFSPGWVVLAVVTVALFLIVLVVVALVVSYRTRS